MFLKLAFTLVSVLSIPNGSKYGGNIDTPIGRQRINVDILNQSHVSVKLSGLINIEDQVMFTRKNSCLNVRMSSKLKQKMKAFGTSIHSIEYSRHDDKAIVTLTHPPFFGKKLIALDRL